MEDERNMQGRVVDKKSVRLFSVLAQALPVITAQHNKRVLIEVLFLQKANEPAHLLVRKSDLAIIQTILVFRTEGRRRMVGIMWIVKVHPEEKFLLVILL